MTGRDTSFKVMGVDLAADAKNTAYCEVVVTSRDGKAKVCRPEPGADDEELLKRFGKGVARIGIDAPFGWPLPFVLALQSHAQHDVWPSDRRRKDRHFAALTLRSTDIHVDCAVNGVTPLSVSADRIAVVAMRAALLLSCARESLHVDRSGMAGHFVEVYPAAAFARWGIERAGYKNKKDAVRRQCILEELKRRSGIEFEVTSFVETDHAVDALASAVVALMAELDRRMAAQGVERLTCPVPSGMRKVAEREGWIVLPKKCSLERLEERLKLLDK